MSCRRTPCQPACEVSVVMLRMSRQDKRHSDAPVSPGGFSYLSFRLSGTSGDSYRPGPGPVKLSKSNRPRSSEGKRCPKVIYGRDALTVRRSRIASPGPTPPRGSGQTCAFAPTQCGDGRVNLRPGLDGTDCPRQSRCVEVEGQGPRRTAHEDSSKADESTRQVSINL